MENCKMCFGWANLFFKDQLASPSIPRCAEREEAQGCSLNKDGWFSTTRACSLPSDPDAWSIPDPVTPVMSHVLQQLK